MATPTPAPRLYHLAVRDEWETALRSGAAYRRSTLHRSLEDEGFIHCSFAPQVRGVADLAYRNRADIVLLEIDPARLESDVRIEDLDGNGAYPHIYGPLPVGAVVAVHETALDPDGTLALPSLGTG